MYPRRARRRPEYDVQEDRSIEEEQPKPIMHDGADIDDVLSRGRYDTQNEKYTQKDTYFGKGTAYMEPHGVVVDSWSYNSLFPSMRTWSSLFALATGPVVAMMFDVDVNTANATAMSLMFPAAIGLLVLAGMLSALRLSVTHAVKDTFVHGTVLLAVGILYPWGMGADAFINVALLYIASHLIAHAFDFHLERSKGRGWKLFLLTVCCTWILIGFGYKAFDLNIGNVFR